MKKLWLANRVVIRYEYLFFANGSGSLFGIKMELSDDRQYLTVVNIKGGSPADLTPLKVRRQDLQYQFTAYWSNFGLLGIFPEKQGEFHAICTRKIQ